MWKIFVVTNVQIANSLQNILLNIDLSDDI